MAKAATDRAGRLVITVALLVGLTLPAAAEDGGLRERVLARLRQAEQADVSVEVRDGEVRLAGTVRSLDAARKAEKAARAETDRVVSAILVAPEARSDVAIRKDATEAILRYPYYTVFDSVELSVANGLIVLAGSVKEPYRRSDLEDRVARVLGAKAIRNEIQVQPVSLSDDRLRYELLRRIYGNDAFTPYAVWADPPIRIVVDRGRVTLTGYVASAVEQVLVGQIARGTLAFSVDNRVQVEGEPPTTDRRKSET